MNDDSGKVGHDFAPLLQKYLSRKYGIDVSKAKGRAHLSFPSGYVIHVRGSKKLENGEGFYFLQEEDYKEIVNNTNWFFAIVFGDVEKTFVLPGKKMREIFDGQPLTYQEGKKPKWYFDIREKDSRFILRLHYGGAKEHDITEYQNSWKDIIDRMDKKKSEVAVFLTGYTYHNIQISKRFSIVGWKQRPSKLFQGNYIFVYDITNRRLDSCFRIGTPSENKEPIWQTETQSNPPRVQFHHRWNAQLIATDLNISLETVKGISPFSGTEGGKKANFPILVAGDSPSSLDKPIYTPFRDFLLNQLNRSANKMGLTLEELIKGTFFEEKDIKDLEDLLNEKQQIIFYGPPGTSKTYLARKFAAYFTGTENNVKVVQFHPSYSYEDFVEGIRPITSQDAKTVGFSKQAGLFIKLVDECKSRPAEKFVLIIDEINRGNISKIFGELIYLLEYRDEKLFLTYSPDKEFSIPSNLYMIGTMNSADRSIAYIDYALRRRFYFRGFYPNYDVMTKWFEENPSKLDSKEYPKKIINILREVNSKIEEVFGVEYQIGHSYFMVNDLDEQRLKRIIEYSIKPLLEQYFYGKKDEIEDLVKTCKEMLPEEPSAVV